MINQLLTFPLYILKSPFKGFSDMKYDKTSGIKYAIMILIIAGMARVFQVLYTGFILRGIHHDVRSINLIQTLTMFYAPILLFVIANWSITTITNGKGTITEILKTYAYAMYPMIFCRVIATILSNVVTAEEAFFSAFFVALGTFLTYAYLFVGLIVIHEYTFLKAILMVILTILAMMLIVFVLALFASLLSNFVSFIFIFIQELEPHLT